MRGKANPGEAVEKETAFETDGESQVTLCRKSALEKSRKKKKNQDVKSRVLQEGNSTSHHGKLIGQEPIR